MQDKMYLTFVLRWKGPGWYRNTLLSEGDVVLEWAYPPDFDYWKVIECSKERSPDVFYRFINERRAREFMGERVQCLLEIYTTAQAGLRRQ